MEAPMTRVWNYHKRGIQPGDVYIGRPGHGQSGYFGNPIQLGHRCPVCTGVHTKKGSTIPCFEVWARDRLQRDPEYYDQVRGLHGKDLVCFCAPGPCHGGVLVRLAEELNPHEPEIDLMTELFGGE